MNFGGSCQNGNFFGPALVSDHSPHLDFPSTMDCTMCQQPYKGALRSIELHFHLFQLFKYGLQQVTHQLVFKKVFFL